MKRERRHKNDCGNTYTIWQHVAAAGEPRAGLANVPLGENVIQSEAAGSAHSWICPQLPSQALAGAAQAHHISILYSI